MQGIWIDTTEGLAAAISGLASGPLGIDLEADSFHHFQEKVCLIQVSDGATDWLIDPLAGLDLSLLAPLLGTERRRKVLHGADYDVRMLRAGAGLELRGLFDTMIAARLVGERAFGLAALLERHLGIELDKRFQRADWSIRPLPDSLRDYAVADTRHLSELAARLERRLTELGRTTWAKEEFERLEQVEARAPDPMPWRRIKGAASLEPRELAMLRELSTVRDEFARASDRPRFRVLHDDVLVEAARQLVRSGPYPERITGLPRSWLQEASRRRLAEAAQRVSAMPSEELPERLARGRPRYDAKQERRVREAAKRRDGLAGSLGLEPTVLASRSQLEDALESIATGHGLDRALTLRAWQRNLLEPLFADLS